MGLVVNLDEFSELCGVTAETMRVHIRGVEGEQGWLIERGDRGRGYKIEAEGGLAWWKAKRADDEAQTAERRAQLAQLRFDHLGEAAEDSDNLTLSGKARREEYAAVMDRIKLRRMMGELVEWAELEPLLASAAVELRRQVMLIPGEFAAMSGLPPEDVQHLHGLLERALNQFVGALPRRTAPGDGNA